MTSEPLIIIQARLDSCRLPRKTLALIDGLPSIVYQYRRVRQSNKINNIVVAIPDTQQNNDLEDVLTDYHVPVYRGHPSNLLNRYIECASFYKSQTILRINGDCPLISASSIDKTFETYINASNAHYTSTILDNSFPLGEHCECFALESLIYAKASLNPTEMDCEHVTPILYNNPKVFTCLPVKHPNLQHYNQLIRLCVDYPEDLLFVRALLKKAKDASFDLMDIIRMIDDNPELLRFNSHLIKDRRV